MINKDLNIGSDETQKNTGELIETIRSDVKANVSENLELISKIYTALGAELRYPYTINKEHKGKNQDYIEISVLNSDIPKNLKPEVLIIIQPNGNAVLKVYPNNHPENLYFGSKEITQDQLLLEIRKIRDILTTGEIQGASLLVEQSEDPSDYE